MCRQIFLTGLAASLMFTGCKLVNKGSQAKVDDSDTRKTITQQEMEKTGQPGTKMFNVTRLFDKDGNKSISIPIALSLEIKNRNIIDKAAFRFDLPSLSYVKHPQDTKLTAIIKDLRHAHSRDSAQKLTLIFDRIYKQYRGKNKYGKYAIEFYKSLSNDRNPSEYTEIGNLKFISSNTGATYRAPLVAQSPNEEWLTPFKEGRFSYESSWTDAIPITEDMFSVMQGKVKSPSLPANSEFKRNCLDTGLLAKQTEGKIVYYQQGQKLSRDNQSYFRIYGLNGILAKGVVSVDSLDCYKHDKNGLSHVFYDNVYPHPGLPPTTFDSHGEKVKSIYISNTVREQSTFHSILISEKFFSLVVGKSKIDYKTSN